jgi:chromosomal replication initiator protein
METVCRRYDIRWPDLISSKRSKKLVRARQISMYLCKTMTPHSFVLIGQWLGNRDHTTIMYGYRKVEGMRRWDSDFDNEVESLVAELLS